MNEILLFRKCDKHHSASLCNTNSCVFVYFVCIVICSLYCMYEDTDLSITNLKYHLESVNYNEFLAPSSDLIFFMLFGFWNCFGSSSIVLLVFNSPVILIFCLLWWFFFKLIWRTVLMRYIRGWKIKSLAEEEIRMHCWLLACTSLVDKKTSHAL